VDTASAVEKRDDLGLEKRAQQSRTGMPTATSPRAHFAEEGGENVTALIGQPAVLFCRVKNLGNKTVSNAPSSLIRLRPPPQ
jgi:hypothetical protein